MNFFETSIFAVFLVIGSFAEEHAPHNQSAIQAGVEDGGDPGFRVKELEVKLLAMKKGSTSQCNTDEDKMILQLGVTPEMVLKVLGMDEEETKMNLQKYGFKIPNHPELGEVGDEIRFDLSGPNSILNKL